MQNLNHMLDTAVWGHTAVISLYRGNRIFKKEAKTSAKKNKLKKKQTTLYLKTGSVRRLLPKISPDLKIWGKKMMKKRIILFPLQTPEIL